MSKTKMNPKVKAAWVADLRSKKFEQVKRELRNDDNGRCCLGVLCDTRAKQTKKKIWDKVISSRYNGKLNDNMLKWSGLDDDTQRRLINYNDNKSKSFKWIASYIERYL